MKCKFCKANCIKAGKQRNGAQKFYCNSCKKYQQKDYTYSAYKPGVNEMLPKLICESVSIRGIGRILNIALPTVIKRVKLTAAKIIKPPIPFNCKAIELDEI